MSARRRPHRGVHRGFERDVLGAPAVPPGRLASWANSGRRRLLGVHRHSAPPPLRILEALFAQFDAHALRVLVELKIPDELAEPRTVEDLAQRIGADHRRLERFVRFAAARGLVSVDARGTVSASGVTTALRGDAAAPWRGWVRFATSPWFDAAWRNLGPSLAPGQPPAFELTHRSSFFEYTTQADPDAGAVFDEAMAAGAMLQAIGLARVLEWNDVMSVCDVGGGTGAALDVLQRYEPHVEAVLFDLPDVVRRCGFAADRPEGLRRAVVGGSFFDAVPPGHDRYLLLAIVHDWDDERATELLVTVRDAMGAHAEAIVVENVAADRPRDDFANASDLLMFVLATGRERDRRAYRALFEAAGLHIHGTHLLPTGATAFTLKTQPA